MRGHDLMSFLLPGLTLFTCHFALIQTRPHPKRASYVDEKPVLWQRRGLIPIGELWCQ